MSDVIARNPSHFVHAIILSAVYSKFNRAGPKVWNYVQNMARSVRSKERVNYIALNNLSSTDIEPVSTGKRKYKPWAKLYQVERLVSKRKSSNKPLCWCLSEPAESMHSGFNLKTAWLRVQCRKRQDNQPRSQGLSSLHPLVVGRNTLVAAGHVTTQNLGGKKICWIGGVAEYFVCWCDKL